MRAKIAALGLFAACCAPAWSNPVEPLVEPGTITVCVDLPEKRIEGARQAISLWEGSLRNWKRVVMVEATDGPGCDKIVIEAEPEADTKPETAAWVNGTGGREIRMVRGRYEYDVTGFLLHELGHAFGAQHLAGTLMNPTISYFGPRCPDGPTVAQVAAWNRVEIELLSWCAP